jgi:hypothetical protein
MRLHSFPRLSVPLFSLPLFANDPRRTWIVFLVLVHPFQKKTSGVSYCILFIYLSTNMQYFTPFSSLCKWAEPDIFWYLVKAHVYRGRNLTAPSSRCGFRGLETSVISSAICTLVFNQVQVTEEKLVSLELESRWFASSVPPFLPYCSQKRNTIITTWRRVQLSITSTIARKDFLNSP